MSQPRHRVEQSHDGVLRPAPGDRVVAAAEAGVVSVEEGVHVQEQRVAGAGAGEQQHQGGDGEDGPHGGTLVPRAERLKGSRWCL